MNEGWESDGTLGLSSKVEGGSRPGQMGVLFWVWWVWFWVWIWIWRWVR